MGEVAMVVVVVGGKRDQVICLSQSLFPCLLAMNNRLQTSVGVCLAGRWV